MAKGTPSMGKRNRIVHIRCRRCGRHTYHIRKSWNGKKRKDLKINHMKVKTARMGKKKKK